MSSLRLALDYKLKPTEQAQFVGDGPVGVGVSSYLIRGAVTLRYGKTMPRVLDGKRGPGVMWGSIRARLDARPEVLELSQAEMVWLLETWTDTTVQNGFPPDLQTWVNVLDEEMAKLV